MHSTLRNCIYAVSVVALLAGRGVGAENPPAPVATAAASSAVPAPAVPAAGALKLSLGEAVLRALERNSSFRVDRLQPAISQTYEQSARAAFDPTLSAEVSVSHDRNEVSPHDDSDNTFSRGNGAATGVGVSQLFPTGTTVEASVERALTDTEAPLTDTRDRASEYGLTVTQPLLRGAGKAVNLAALRSARINTRVSKFELRGVAETLVADVETAYWNYILAADSLSIYSKSVEIAEKQIEETRERVRLGSLAETELAAAEAEVAKRQEDLINARGTLATARLKLVRYLNPGDSLTWNTAIDLTDKPDSAILGEVKDVEAHVASGLKNRADLNQARLQVELGQIEVVQTRNGLLPRLDAFVRLGGSLYADSFYLATDRHGETRDAEAGLRMEHSLFNRDERATHDRATYSLEQTRSALVNMEELVQVDVRSAHVEVARAAEQRKATTATRKLREVAHRAEREKFLVGKSTALLVAQAWRDLLDSQISEIEAVIAYRKAILNLYRLDGTLLEQRGVSAQFQP